MGISRSLARTSLVSEEGPPLLLLLLAVKVRPDVAAVDREPPRLRIERGGGGDGQVAAVADVVRAAAHVVPVARADDGVAVAAARDRVL